MDSDKCINRICDILSIELGDVVIYDADERYFAVDGEIICGLNSYDEFYMNMSLPLNITEEIVSYFSNIYMKEW